MNHFLDLLEKNRVIHQGSAERNYHIFYQLLYATSDEDLQKLCLISRKSEDFEFLNKGVASVDRIDDHEEYEATVVSLKLEASPFLNINRETYLFWSTFLVISFSKIDSHCMKSVRIRSYSGPYIPTFGLNTERCGLFLRIQSGCGEIRARITPNTGTFYAVSIAGIVL